MKECLFEAIHGNTYCAVVQGGHIGPSGLHVAVDTDRYCRYVPYVVHTQYSACTRHHMLMSDWLSYQSSGYVAHQCTSCVYGQAGEWQAVGTMYEWSPYVGHSNLCMALRRT